MVSNSFHSVIVVYNTGVMSLAQAQVMASSTVVNSVKSIGGFSVFQRTGVLWNAADARGSSGGLHG